MNIKSFGALALGIVALALGACAATPFAGYSRDPLAVTAIFQNEDCDQSGCEFGSNKNPKRLIPSEAVAGITHYGKTCAEDTAKQVAGPVQSAASGALSNAAASGGGLALGIPYVKGDPATYGPYGAVVGAAGGLNSGALTGAFSSATTRGKCVDDKFADAGAKAFPGTHTATVTAGKKIGVKLELDETPVLKDFNKERNKKTPSEDKKPEGS